MLICPFDRLIVKRHEMDNKTPGGIIIPDRVKSKHPPRRGDVVDVGDQCKYVKVGDMVVFDDAAAYYDGIPNDLGGVEEFVFLEEKNILAIERKEL
jgi:chaperonin GroES